jgi:SNF2 family DNA or RNA helicase
MCIPLSGCARYACLVVDEVHLFANPKTIQSKALRALVGRCGCRVGLTGTPMSNKHAELFHLLSTLHPGCLGEEKDFNDYYARPIKRGGAITAEAEARRLGNRRLAELNRCIGPLMLRRTKEEYLKDVLKQKFDRVVFCALTPLQRDL